MSAKDIDLLINLSIHIVKMDHKKGIPAAADIVPPPVRVNSLQALVKLRPIRGCEWCCIAFVLNRDMIKSDGTLDDLHAVIFHLGSFEQREKAEEHAKNIIATTGHPGVIVSRYGAPVKLSSNFDPNTVVDVPVDIQGRLVELETAQYKLEREGYEKRAKAERDRLKEAEEETDPNSIEHFKRQCYLAIKNRSRYLMHKKESEAAWQDYKKRESLVRSHFQRHPDHESAWLPHLKEKLTERGELDLYNGMESAYKEIRDELLGLNENKPVRDNIACECPGGSCWGLPRTCPPEGICLAQSEGTVCLAQSEGAVCQSSEGASVRCPNEVCINNAKKEGEEAAKITCARGMCTREKKEESGSIDQEGESDLDL